MNRKNVKRYAVSFLIATATTIAIIGVFEILTKTIWSLPFSEWEGVFFAYPNAHGWRPHYLSSFLSMVLVPTFVCRLLQRQLPPLVFKGEHRWDCLGILAIVIICFALFHFLGQSETYGDWFKAAALTTPVLLFLAFTSKLQQPGQGGVAGISGGWLLVNMLLGWVFVVSLKPDAIIAVFIFNLMFIGFAEEYAFRGVIQGYLLDTLPSHTLIGISSSNFISAALFALIHNPSLSAENLPRLLTTFSMGLAFGVARERTGSWFAPAMAHGANAFYFLIIMAMSK